MKRTFRTTKWFTLATLMVLFWSCGENGQADRPDDNAPNEISIEDANNALGEGLLKLDNEIFSLPSPVQTAILLKKNAIDYDESLVNPTEHERRYINRFQKALNMGVYGADLAYLSNFNNTQLKNEYLSVVEKIAIDMDIRNHIDQSLIDRFAKHIDVRDSLYALNAELFTVIDSYLKENDEGHVAALILTGGWVEAMHVSLSSASDNQDVRNRIGEQVTAVRSLLRLLKKMDDTQAKELYVRLSQVAEAFDGVTANYEYVKPITDPSERVTYFNSKSSVIMSDAQLQNIADQLRSLREFIIQ
jgi:hypothetical protein